MLEKFKNWKELIIWIIDWTSFIAGGHLIYLILKPITLISSIFFLFICYCYGFAWGWLIACLKKREFINPFSSKKDFQIKFFTYMIPKKYRDEFLGDLLEQRSQMQEENQPNWYVNLVSFGQIFWVAVAMLKIRLWDWVDPEKEKNK